MKSIYWVRNDLRTTGNSLFADFLARDSEKLVVIVPDRSLLQRAKAHRISFAIVQMYLFKKKLDLLGVNSLILWGASLAVLSEIQLLWPFDEMFYSRSLGTEESEDERLIQKKFFNVTFVTKDPDNLIQRHQLNEISTRAPKSFTQFRKIVEVTIPRVFPVQSQTKANTQALDPQNLSLVKFKLLEKKFLIPPHQKLSQWSGDGMDRLVYLTRQTKRMLSYAATRNGMIEFDDSSKLSPWIALGCMSPQIIWNEVSSLEDVAGVTPSTTGYKHELLWREYFRYLFMVQGSSFFSKQQNIAAPSNEQHVLLEQWKQGETNSPFVNANMRELMKTGWMSNRGRQNVASFLAKELCVDWRLGASYFEECLIDYDPFNNWGNWGYLAGVGTDPRDRKFNPELQAKIYDPDGAYQKLWL